MENYFVTDNVLDLDSNEGLEIIVTNTSNRLPKDIKPFYLHKENNNATMKHAKATIFFEPIVAVKMIREVSIVCMFLFNQRHPVILHLLML